MLPDMPLPELLTRKLTVIVWLPPLVPRLDDTFVGLAYILSLVAFGFIHITSCASGSFCIGKCNRVGVTVQVEDEVHVGVTRENFNEFFKTNILDVIRKEGA